MKNLNKKILLIFVFLLFVSPVSLLAAEKNKEVVNDQTFAKELAKTEVDFSLASGWYEDKSSIYTTLFDENGKYRGYRTTQIFANNIDDAIINDYKEDGEKVCSIFELNTINVDYQGSTHEAIDFICTQEVGNENVAKIDGDKLTINSDFGKTEGYLVGISMRNNTFVDVVGGEVKNDVVYVLDNNGGSAKITPIMVDGENTTSDEKKLFDFIPIILIIAISVILLIIIIVIIIKLKNKNKSYFPNNQLNNKQQVYTQSYQAPQAQPFVNNDQFPQQTTIINSPQSTNNEIYESVEEFFNVNQGVEGNNPNNYPPLNNQPQNMDNIDSYPQNNPFSKQ